jgi:hypothetical protein
MARPPGLPKTGGRKAGVPNIRSLGFVEHLRARNFSTLDRLIDLLESGEFSTREEALILLQLLQYEFPKRKAIDLRPDSSFENSIAGLAKKLFDERNAADYRSNS